MEGFELVKKKKRRKCILAESKEGKKKEMRGNKKPCSKDWELGWFGRTCKTVWV